MTRISYRSTAGLAVVIAGVIAAVIFGSNQGMDAVSAQAQSSRVGDASTASDSTGDPVQVTAVSPTVEDLNRETTQPAHIEAKERTDIHAKASGFVSKVLVDIGDQVEEDQLLAELWIPEMQQEERQKAALVEQAQATIKQAQARLASAEALIAAAEAKVTETQSAIVQQQAEVAFRRSEHGRISELVAKNSVNASLEDEKLHQLRAAEAALAAAKAQVQSAVANVKVENARLLQAHADVAVAQAQLSVAESDLAQIRIIMKYAQIRAPYSGLVTRRWTNTGDFVASAASAKSEPLFTVDRTDRLRIIFDVPESESAMIRIGQPAALVVDAWKDRSFTGRVVRSTGVLDPRTRTLRVEAELTEPDPRLRPGMFGMIRVTLAERPQAVLLPARCIRFEGKSPFVYCVSQGVVEKRAVELGYADGARTEIISGVRPSDMIVLESRAPIQPGRPVQIANKSNALRER